MRAPTDWTESGDNKPEYAMEDIFRQLYDRHAPSLHQLAFRVTRSDQQSKDIIQEVFLKLWGHRAEIAVIDNMEAWLYRVTENKLMDFLRKTAADERLRQALWNRAKTSVDETEELLEAKECSSNIHKAISLLPPQRQLIYQLNREKGLNYKEIAEALSISRHTVKNQISMALRSIQRFLLLLVVISIGILSA
ncbi:MAG TPA: RNA polymerase sigma-70 factor [Puia sp.]|nr:RNA polymerase sigma-70 factor [Puia sp.]